MKKFQFPLETVRKLRHHQWELESMKLGAIRQEMAQLDEMGEQLRAWGDLEENEVMRKSILKPRELNSLDGFRAYLTKQEARLEGLRAATAQRLAAQSQRLQEARRAAELLDKLKERAHQRWEKEINKQWDAFAEEVFISQWRRNS